MSDLIDRQAAIDALNNIEIPRNASWYQYYQQALTAVDKLPPAQLGANLAEVVHCKDCKHWIPYDWMFSEVWQSRNINDYPEDEIGCNYCDMTMKANDFCSRGERREVTE